LADRRMFSKTITDSARFLKMPLTTQALYFHLGCHADDDGVVEAFSVMNMCGAAEDDLKLLVAKELVVVLNDDLVSYILDWNTHNKLRADRKIDSVYKDLLLQIIPDVKLIESRERADRRRGNNKTGRPTDDQGTSNGRHRIGKDRIGKDSNIIYCSELQVDSKPICREKVVISLPLANGTEYDVTESDIEKWKSFYPAVDIMKELKKMCGWFDGNPNRRKTDRGIRRAITNWLAKEQDKGGGNKVEPKADPYHYENLIV